MLYISIFHITDGARIKPIDFWTYFYRLSQVDERNFPRSHINSKLKGIEILSQCPILLRVI